MDADQFMIELKSEIARWVGDTVLGLMLTMKNEGLKTRVGSYMKLTMVGARAKATFLNLDVEDQLVQLETWTATWLG